MAEDTPQSGVLYIVSTPIGNLKDITFRAVEVLKSVDLIAAEDTRRSRILCSHYEIATPLTSFFAQNQRKKAPSLIRELQAGKSIAVISDAGTPGVSDPAFHLVRLAIEAGIRIEAIPGASALLTALVISGLETRRFVFEGFLPVKKGRQTRLKKLALEERTIVFYESPHRLVRTLRDLADHFGERRAVLARELTKIHEEIVRMSLPEMLLWAEQHPKLRGEFVIIVEGKKA